jgi:hypothetical protein
MMPCEILQKAFLDAETQAGLYLNVGFAVHVIEFARVIKTSDIVSGSGQLQYHPIRRNSLPSFGGTVKCNAVKQTPVGQQSLGNEEVSVQIELANSYPITLTTKTGPLPVNGTFTPICHPFGVNGLFITGFVESFPVSMWVTFGG